ncbi:hypothetical protein GHT06_004497 [Daphnia sinensis]|uniref:Uncharacterized protein n=1 Tax=Daphnia sinensis TaxID=1820382 RepID=A0AAD5KE25_9CRUS|nr:hypothetical protein GHT06_004497 [Daphnia sinensis]
MTSTERLAIVSPSKGLHVFDNTTNSLWVFDGANWVNYATQSKFGDMKSGIQTADHDGWFKTNNARSVSGSNTTILAQANLPNVTFSGTAANAGGHNHGVDPAAVNTLTNGSHSHSMSFNNDDWNGQGGGNTSLEDDGGGTYYRYTSTEGTATNGGGHNHGFDPAAVNTTTNGAHSHSMSFNNDDYNNWGGGNTSLDNDGGGIYYRYTSTEGNHAHSVDIPYTTSTSVSDHTHTVTVSSGGSATPINIAPRSLSVNMFIYLGF